MCPGGVSDKDYKSLKVAQLRAELSRRDLPIKGNKAELVSRLEDNDVVQEIDRISNEGAAAAPADADSPMGDAEAVKGDQEMTAEDEGDEVRMHVGHALCMQHMLFVCCYDSVPHVVLQP